MPPKRGKKRGRRAPNSTANGNESSSGLTPHRDVWSGWIEMESEPAFFNVMLKEMGVKGLKVHEVYSIDDAMLAVLPQPVHALIFLFRYRETDWAESKTDDYPKHVWFANQTPDFACATFALLNIINNIPELELGRELQDFKTFTENMTPLARGDAIDNFVFVKKIHNSFACQNDILQADMHVKAKAAKLKKRQAVEKARATRVAQKQSSIEPVTTTKPTRSSMRSRKPTKRSADDPKDIERDDSDADYVASKRSTDAKAEDGPRRSTRTPKARLDSEKYARSLSEEKDDQGFHFIAYMPVEDHVWKLDGLERAPQDLGMYDRTTNNWMAIVQPALMSRMAQYEGAEIEFNLMAVVQDPLDTDTAALAANIKAMKTLENKLNSLSDDWRVREGSEMADGVIMGAEATLRITEESIDLSSIRPAVGAKIEYADDLCSLTELRGELVSQQAPLRAAVRDAIELEKSDAEQAKHRRHDYGTFIREWLSALANNEILGELLKS